MANVIKHKRGSGSDPVASDLVVGEVAIRTDVGKLFTKMDNGSVAEIAGGGSDIAINTLSASSGTGGGSATFNGSAFRFTLSAPPSVSAQQLLVSINGVIQKPVPGTGQPSEGFSVDGTDIILGDAPEAGSDFFIITFKSLGVSEPADNSVTSAKIADGAIVNADINASAAIAGSKISPAFTSDISITNTSPTISFVDSNHNPDFMIRNADGGLIFNDTTNQANRLVINTDGHIDVTGNLDVGSGLDVTGAITATGNVEIGSSVTNQFSHKLCIEDTGGSIFYAQHSTSGIQLKLNLDNTNNVALFGTVSSDDLQFVTANNNALRIDSSGRLLVGSTSTQTIGGNSHPLVQLNVNSNQQVLTLARFEDNSGGPTLVLGKSRASSAGNYTSVQDGDSLGSIQFSGADGTDLISVGASIEAKVNGTPGSNDMPGILTFSTTADGASSPTSAMTIDSSGDVLIGTNSSVNVASSSPALLQVEHASGNISAAFYSTANAAGPAGVLALGHARGGSTGALVDDDVVGEIRFAGGDGSDINTQAALIQAKIDGSPSSNNMPTDLIFFTNSGGQSVGQRMIIHKNGDIGAPTGDNVHDASDERLKENIIELSDCLNKINQLKPISYNYKTGWNKYTEGKTKYGFGAQTTQKVDELLIESFSDEDVDLNGVKISNILRVNEKFIIPMLVKAIQELSAKVEALEAN